MAIKLTLKRNCEHCGKQQVKDFDEHSIVYTACDCRVPGGPSPYPKRFSRSEVIIEEQWAFGPMKGERTMDLNEAVKIVAEFDRYERSAFAAHYDNRNAIIAVAEKLPHHRQCAFAGNVWRTVAFAVLKSQP